MRPHPPQDHYAVLGVARTASWEEIRAAFRARAKALHPDKNRHRDTREDFQRLREAYVALRHLSHVRTYRSQPAPAVEKPAPMGAWTPEPAVRPRWIWQQYPRAAVALLLAALALVSWGIHAWVVYEPSASPDVIAALEDEFRISVAALLAEPEESSPAGVPLVGRAGQTYVVPPVDYKKLRSIQDRLLAEQGSMERRKAELDRRRRALEKEQNTLLTSNAVAVTEFQLRVHAFNRDAAALKRVVEIHTKEVESYFQQIENAAIASK